MKRLQNFLWFLYKCFAIYTLIVYALILWIPSDGWLAGFIMMSFPIVIVVHAISIPIWFFIQKKRAILPISLLLIGCIFLPRTFSYRSDSGDQGSSKGNTFSILSYNVHVFMRNSEPWHHPKVKKDIELMKNWMVDSGADILCMPEYYEDATKTFSINEFFTNAGYRYNSKFSHVEYGEYDNYYVGLRLYSKHPIISARDTIFEAQNGMIQADIKIRNDTVRIIGVHLYSMMLNLSKLTHQKGIKGIKKEGKFTFDRMRNGFVQRSRELSILESWINESPYPVIVSGDFNEVPYGYVYGKLKETMSNSFEEKGSGFGFTFKNLPYFIRIDHQFFTPGRLQVHDFVTLNKIKYSDHYPIMGTYSIVKK